MPTAHGLWQACVGYRLPLDNNGEAWRWVSNYQVITAVSMHKHPTLPNKIWQIRSAERQTVIKKFKDMQTVGDGGGSGGAGGELVAATLGTVTVVGQRLSVDVGPRAGWLKLRQRKTKRSMLLQGQQQPRLPKQRVACCISGRAPWTPRCCP